MLALIIFLISSVIALHVPISALRITTVAIVERISEIAQTTLPFPFHKMLHALIQPRTIIVNWI